MVLCHSPNAKLGYARQLGLEEYSTEYIFMLDDDIEFEKGFAEACYNELKKIPDAFALSPIIVFGDDRVLLDLFHSIKKDRESVSGGCCILNRELLNSIGGIWRRSILEKMLNYSIVQKDMDINGFER